MGFIKDAVDFELFHGKDILKKLKSHPQRLITGVDPWSTKIWNKISGSNHEPIVDQMGGAYGGHTLSAFGRTDGGVYGRAREAGIDTRAGESMQDAAHVISALYAGGYGASKISQGNAAGGQGFQMPSMGGQQQTTVDPAEEERKRQEAERRRKMIAASLRMTGNSSYDPVAVS